MQLPVTKNYSATIPDCIQVYGGDYSGECNNEDADLISLVSWVKVNFPKLALLMYHIPNESMMPVQGRVQASKKGLMAKVPDLCFATVPAVYIELKRKCVKQSLPSKVAREHFEGQLKVLEAFALQGNQCYVAFGLEAAKEIIRKYSF
jgi:hypothetical protein